MEAVKDEAATTPRAPPSRGRDAEKLFLKMYESLFTAAEEVK